MERLKPSVSAGAALARKQQQRLTLRALHAEQAAAADDEGLRPGSRPRAGVSATPGSYFADGRGGVDDDVASSNNGGDHDDGAGRRDRGRESQARLPKSPGEAADASRPVSRAARSPRHNGLGADSPASSSLARSRRESPGVKPRGTAKPKPGTPHRSTTPQSAKRRARKRDANSPRASPEGASRKREVVIHVRDKAHKLTRDFFCDKDVLVREMPYFRPYLKDLHKMDISVHCDVKIFEWLMRRIRSPEEARLDIRSATSVLIAAEFLGMKTVVEEATAFVAQHLAEIMALPIDLKCLSDATVCSIAETISLNALIGVSDPRDTIVGKLYRLRAEKLLQEHGTALAECRHCDQLFSRRFADRLICPRAPACVDFHGRLAQRHKPVSGDWDVVRSFIAPARRLNGQSWRKVFWTLWGATKLFQCILCESYFDAATSGDCRAHAAPAELARGPPADPTAGKAGDLRIHPCCAARSDATPRFFACGPAARDGCVRAPHRPRATAQSSPEDAALLVIYANNRCGPVSDRAEDSAESHCMDEGALSSSSAWVRGVAATAPSASWWPTPTASPQGAGTSTAYMLERQRDEDWVNMRTLAQRLRGMRQQAAARN